VCIPLPRGADELGALGEKLDRSRDELHAALKAKNPAYRGDGVFNALGDEITEVTIAACNIRDLSPLRGLPLTVLACGSNEITDLSPLERMPLIALECSENQIADLTPLEQSPLRCLSLNNTHVTDLSPLEGMPIKQLSIPGVRVKDLSVLKTLPLERLGFSSDLIEVDFQFLRTHKSLREIWDNHRGFSVEDFWRRWDEQHPKRQE
jgi:hypothetical protein